MDNTLLHLNHAYGVLDRVTADAIEDAGYLRDFANFHLRTTTGDGGLTWAGRYLLGRRTYLELFRVGDLPGRDGLAGAGGMGLSTEHAGDLATVRARLPGLGVTGHGEFTQTRDFGDGKPVPWFDSVFTTREYDTFSAWAMEYRAEYFADSRGNTGPPGHPGDVGRERYLPDDYRDHDLRDVTGVHFAVTARDLANTEPLLRAGGFAVTERPDGVVAHGGGTTLRFEVAEDVGLRRVEMSLNEPVSRTHTERLGNSALVVGPDSRAVWTFSPPGC